MQVEARNSDLPAVPLADDGLADIQISLTILELLSGGGFESPFEEFNPPKVECNLLLLAVLADLLPIIQKVIVGFCHSLIMLELLVALPDVVLHVGELDESVGLRRLIGCDFDKSMKNASHPL